MTLTSLLNNRQKKELIEIGNQGTTQALNFVLENDNFNSLNLDFNQIDAVGAKNLNTAIRASRNLKSLSLAFNQLGNKGVKIITEGIIKNQSLLHLNISGNQITTDGTYFISKMLKKNNSLKSLDLKWNFLTKRGVIKIANALKKNKSLNILNLEHNNIDDQGFAAICNMLKENLSIEKLIVRKNNIGHYGAKTLSNCLMTNKTLQEIDLSLNKIDNSGAKLIINALRKNKSRIGINLDNNPISENLLKEMHELYLNNRQAHMTSNQKSDKRKTHVDINSNNNTLKLFKDYLSPFLYKDISLERIGCDYDGGYVIPKTMTQHTTKLISIGIGDDVAFEKELLKKNKKVKVFCFDHTIKQLPHIDKEHKARIKLFKTGLGQGHKNLISLNEAFECCKIQPNDVVILKIDAEGAEWNSGLDLFNFAKVDCIVVELHSLSRVYRHDLYEKCLNKITKDHQCLHIHGNNAIGLQEIDGKHYPEIIEATYLNNKHCLNKISRISPYACPREFDQKNIETNEELVFNYWN